MTTLRNPAAAQVHPASRATLPWVPTMTRRQRRDLAARLARRSSAPARPAELS
jgi:hypothetical protein